jgi:hypothetical protein
MANEGFHTLSLQETLWGIKPISARFSSLCMLASYTT